MTDATRDMPTKGPWFDHGPINANDKRFGVTAGAPYDPSIGARRRICWVGNPSPVNEQLSDVAANARLIAAAGTSAQKCKDMGLHPVKAIEAAADAYAALDLILPLAKGYSPSNQTPEARKTCQGWIQTAEAALAAAKLETDDGKGGA